MATPTYSGWIILPGVGILGRADKASGKELDAVIKRAYEYERICGVKLV